MQFQLKVTRAGLAPVSMRLEAGSDAEACRIAEQQGYAVLRVRARAGLLSKRASKFPLLLFCQELRVLLEAGLTLPECIATLVRKETRSEARSTLDALLVSLREGLALSDALAKMPQHFPSLFVASVRACETTGSLAEGLMRFSLYLEQVDVLRKRIISASIYPALVLSFGVLVLAFLLGFVVPRFSRIYEGRNMHLSTASEWLLWTGQLVEHHGLLILLGAVAVIGAIIFALMQPAVRAGIGHAIIRLPQIGARFRMYHLSRLYRTLGMLLRSGMPVLSALGMVNDLLGHTLQLQVAQARRLIGEGRLFSEAMDECSLTTPVALQLFRAGEKSGRLELMMERTASFHEEEMLRWVDAFTKLFEPLLMAAIGILIGLIVLMMYLPIFELASGLQ
ncbi:MAG: type II secretion system F family protein [Methylophilaceae bacterium]